LSLGAIQATHSPPLCPSGNKSPIFSILRSYPARTDYGCP
jgi:hypothetical protein